MIIRAFQKSDQDAVITLWQSCDLLRPWNDPVKDIQRKFGVGNELFLLGLKDDAVIASVMGGYEGHRGWVNYLAVSPEHQRKGYARQIMSGLETQLIKLGCPKLNLQVRDTNTSALKFYQSLGYEQDDVVSLGKRLIPGS